MDKMQVDFMELNEGDTVNTPIKNIRRFVAEKNWYGNGIGYSIPYHVNIGHTDSGDNSMVFGYSNFRICKLLLIEKITNSKS